MTVEDWWKAKYEVLSAENDKLRVLLATSNANCAFCGLPAAEMAKCASDFPGCSRADDMILCVHPTRQDLLDEVERLREDAARNRWCEEMKADVKFSLVLTRWHVSWVINGDYFAVNHTDRNAAIDAARGGEGGGMNDHAERLRHMAEGSERLRHMAEGWLRAEEDVEKYRTTREEKINSGRYYRAQAAALLAGAEALEQLDAMESASSTMLPKSASASEVGQ